MSIIDNYTSTPDWSLDVSTDVLFNNNDNGFNSDNGLLFDSIFSETDTLISNDNLGISSFGVLQSDQNGLGDDFLSVDNDFFKGDDFLGADSFGVLQSDQNNDVFATGLELFPDDTKAFDFPIISNTNDFSLATSINRDSLTPNDFLHNNIGNTDLGLGLAAFGSTVVAESGLPLATEFPTFATIAKGLARTLTAPASSAATAVVGTFYPSPLAEDSDRVPRDADGNPITDMTLVGDQLTNNVEFVSQAESLAGVPPFTPPEHRNDPFITPISDNPEITRTAGVPWGIEGSQITNAKITTLITPEFETDIDFGKFSSPVDAGVPDLSVMMNDEPGGSQNSFIKNLGGNSDFIAGERLLQPFETWPVVAQKELGKVVGHGDYKWVYEYPSQSDTVIAVTGKDADTSLTKSIELLAGEYEAGVKAAEQYGLPTVKVIDFVKVNMNTPNNEIEGRNGNPGVIMEKMDLSSKSDMYIVGKVSSAGVLVQKPMFDAKFDGYFSEESLIKLQEIREVFKQERLNAGGDVQFLFKDGLPYLADLPSLDNSKTSFGDGESLFDIDQTTFGLIEMAIRHSLRKNDMKPETQQQKDNLRFPPLTFFNM